MMLGYATMSAALRPELPPPRMTIAEFMDWADTVEGRWQLRDGVPEAMSPPSIGHGTIQGELHHQLTVHFRATKRLCRSIIGPGVIPKVNAKRTILVPDLGVICGPRIEARALPNPIVLAEVLSPSNETATRLNVWAYTTIPSMREVLILRSVEIGAEVLRRGQDGSWPDDPDLLGPDDMLRLDSLEFALPLRDLYVESTFWQD